ncbi:DsbE family thiol:disulfide interchange protein [Kangiella sp. TOML190]|uniref:DsbE family thiol:disulfide interchange protein n=1 Tax=Kangiella sp. TOML190 TaxID=2931351 RepID=UPI00203DA624|nr:DsbE family thiol:disulfide interchange protein [Kangiella sp. TOML190]
MSSRRAKRLVIALAPLLLLITLVIIFSASLKKDPRKLETKLLGEKIPTFKLASLTEPERVLTNADLPQEVFLLNIWATWCVSCYAEHPYLVKFSQQYPIKWVGVNYKDPIKDALEYLDQGGDPYLYSIADSDGQLGIDLGVYGAPETFIVDANGVIRDRHVGVIDDRVWQKIILPKLKALGWEANE